MNNSIKLVLTLLGPVLSTQGAVFTFESINQGIPDGTGTGLANVQQLSGLSGVISQVKVSLWISGIEEGAFNGDLYATLQHADGTDTGFAVLLNRPGRRTGDDLGYADNGFQVTFDDAGGAANIHDYQASIPGFTGALLGTWGSDGRDQDPGLVLGDVDVPTAMLDSFASLDPNGRWILFLADLEKGGQARLDKWSLDLELVNVPEPGVWWLVSGLGLVGYALGRRVLPGRR
jgi:hypothetical protein